MFDEAGFPRSCEILPGNAAEPKALKDAIRRLQTVCDGGAKPTVIMDAGIATVDNTAWLNYGL